MNTAQRLSPGRAFGAIVLDTLQEARARWLFWGLFGLSSFLILIFLFALSIDVVQGAQATISFGSNSRPIYDVHKFVVVTYSWISIVLYIWGSLLAIFASAGLVPVLLEPGRIALLLSKPITRTLLLLGRFTGNVLIVLINSTYLIVFIWLILGSKTHVWELRFLVAIPVSVFMFSVMLTVVMLIGVVFESAALSIMVSVAIVLVSILFAQRDWADRLLSSEWSRDLWTALYWVFPKIWDLGGAMRQIVLYDRSADWLTPVWTSAVFGLLVMSGALLIFNKRDF